MTEEEQLEQYNKEFNYIIMKKPVTQLSICQKCKGKGRTEVDPNLDIRCCCTCWSEAMTMKCDLCKGIGYVDNSVKSSA